MEENLSKCMLCLYFVVTIVKRTLALSEKIMLNFDTFRGKLGRTSKYIQ